MNNQIEEFIQNTDNLEIEEFNFEVAGSIYNHTLFKINEFPISGGFGNSNKISRKIAYSEYIERTEFHKLSSSSHKIKTEWGLDIIPTACGFAAGFDEVQTLKRSIKEAVERWVMSKWIDEQYYIEEIHLNKVDFPSNSSSAWFINQFEKIHFYKKNVLIHFLDQFIVITVGLTIAITKNGVYPGSAAQFSDTIDIWEHALLESYRHLLAVKNNKNMDYFPYNKMLYFSKNKNIALDTISRSNNKNWPTPNLSLLKSKFIPEKNAYLSRAIIDGWKSWNLGPIDRFLY